MNRWFIQIDNQGWKYCVFFNTYDHQNIKNSVYVKSQIRVYVQ